MRRVLSAVFAGCVSTALMLLVLSQVEQVDAALRPLIAGVVGVVALVAAILLLPKELRGISIGTRNRFRKKGRVVVEDEVSQSGRVPGKRPQSAAGFLRLSGRALGALADDEPDRIHLCDGPIAAATNEGLRQPGGIVNDGLHAGPPGRAPLATPERFGSDCSCLRWKGIQGRFDGPGERRLTSKTLASTSRQSLTVLEVPRYRAFTDDWDGGET